MIIQKKRKTVKVWQLLIAAFVVGFIASAIHSALTRAATSDVEQPFDHSMCQYPERLSNPPNGCNNEDPARPECMKFGTEDCDLPFPTVEQSAAKPTCKE